jgi:osmotically-inducible protein OsmY
MFGVTGVSNRITVKHDPSTSMIKSDIERALRRRSRAKDTHVSVDVHGHDVSLTGTVPSWWERQSVLHVAWGTSGVWDVTDNMTITR